MEWKQVQTDEDIQELLKAYSGFHDACIASAQYVSGTRVADDGTMWFKGGEDYRLLVLFHSQWEPHYLELYFEGVRRFRLIGQQDNYLNDIYEAFIKFYDEILPWEYTASPRVIVWSDGEFDPESARDGLEEPADTYIIASSLKWRIADGPRGCDLPRGDEEETEVENSSLRLGIEK